MMRRWPRSAAATLATGLVFAGASPAGARSPSSARPGIILLLDVPETMSTALGSDNPVDCSAPERSDFTLVREALTGTMENYKCEQVSETPYAGRNMDPVVHPKASYTGQADDGYIDRYIDDIRFGLLFSEPNPDPGAGGKGGYSYGDNKIARSDPNNIPEVNLGARNAGAPAGAMLDLWPPGGGRGARRTRNNAVQDEINKVIPYGQTSLATFLEDAGYFFANNRSVDRDSNNKNIQCRELGTILITDGHTWADYDKDVEWAGGDGDEPDNDYKGAAEYAAALAAKNIPVHVILMGTGDPDIQARADVIAQRGGTGTAFVVRQPNELTLALDAVVNRVLEGTTSRTRPASTTQTHDTEIDGRAVGLMQVAAAYTIPGGPGPWRGHLEVLDWLCGLEDPELLTSYGEILDLQQPRTIYTAIDGGREAFTTGNNNLTSGLLDVRDQERTEFIQFIRGDDAGSLGKMEHRLGSIVHSSPVVVGPPGLSLPFPGYRAYRTLHKRRPTMVYVGANAGMLHAFTLASHSSNTFDRNELWAYVPASLLDKLEPITDQSGNTPYVDATPRAATVRLYRDANTAPEDEDWRDVLVGGLGAGGRAWYALDVSDPDPDSDDGGLGVLWELPGYNHPGVDANVLDALDGGLAEPRKFLGRSTGRAAFGHVVLDENGKRVERAVAFLPGGRSGDGDGDGDDDDDGGGDQGRVLYVARLEPEQTTPGLPKILRSFRLDGGGSQSDPVEPRRTRYAITGTPTAYQSLAGSQTTRVFVTDAGGRLWRIDTSDTDIAKWTMTMVFDPWDFNGSGRPQSAIYEPALAQRPDGRLVVVYGTGDVDDVEGEPKDHRLYSLTEELEFNARGEIIGVEMKVNWEIAFPDGEQVTGPPIIFDETVYFTSLMIDEDNEACGVGEGRIWAVDFIGDDDSEVVTDDVLARFPAAQAQRRQGFVEQTPPRCDEETPEVDDPAKRALYCVLPGAVFSGLEIIYRPSCEDDFGRSYYPEGDEGSAPQSNTPVLTAQTGGTPPANARGTLPRFGGQPRANKLAKQLHQPRNHALPLMWGVVYE